MKEFQSKPLHDKRSGRVDQELEGTLTTTTVDVTTATATTVNATTLDTNVAAAAVTLTGTTLAADGTDANIDINITPKGTGDVVMSSVDIDGGTIDDVVIGGITPAAVTATDLTASGSISDGTLTITGGDITAAGSITSGDFQDGTITMTGGNITGATSVTATTLTDGTASLTGGDLTGVGTIKTTDNNGTLNAALTNASVDENGDGKHHVTTIILAADTMDPPTAAANEAHGTLLYTFPAGAHLHEVTYMSVALQGGGVVDADTPEVGIGSVIGAGAVAVLNGTPAFMDYITEQTAANCSGTATVAMTGATAGIGTGISLNATGDTKAVHLNYACNWAGADTLTATGTIVLKWTDIA